MNTKHHIYVNEQYHAVKMFLLLTNINNFKKKQYLDQFCHHVSHFSTNYSHIIKYEFRCIKNKNKKLSEDCLYLDWCFAGLGFGTLSEIQ